MTRALMTLIGLMLISSLPAHAEMSPAEAKALIQPFYDMLSEKGSDASIEKARQLIADDWQSFSSNQFSKGKEDTIKAIQGFFKLIPDLKWEMKEVLVSGDKIIVRGEATGTPVGDFFGVPHSGKSFRIMSIDIHQIKNGKMVESHHIEDWAGAMRQLAPKS